MRDIWENSWGDPSIKHLQDFMKVFLENSVDEFMKNKPCISGGTQRINKCLEGPLKKSWDVLKSISAAIPWNLFWINLIKNARNYWGKSQRKCRTNIWNKSWRNLWRKPAWITESRNAKISGGIPAGFSGWILVKNNTWTDLW